MKFARLLRATAFEGMPQMETLFSAYKALKKKIKKLPPKEHQQEQQQQQDTLTAEETEFVQALSDTLNQLNDVYIEKEETSVIRVERLESELATASTPEQLNELHKQFVDFHGEVLLLVHWSILAYTATVKILKKHHKRTGLLVKAPQLGNLLSQPFCSTELMTSIARRVEEDIQRISQRMGLPSQRASEPSQQKPAQQQQQQGSEGPLGTPSNTGAAAMAAAVALAAAAAAACSDNAADSLSGLAVQAGQQTSAGETAAAAAAGGGEAAMPQPQAAPGSAAAAAAAAAAGGGASGSAGGPVQEMQEYGLDLQLLRQLAADSGSQTSRSDDPSAAQDTCASRQQQEQPCSQQANLQQQEQPCSQQANLQQPVAVADEDHLEVQSALKRRRLNLPAEQPAAAAPAAAAGDAAGARSPAAAEAAAAVAAQQPGAASPGVQQQAAEQQQQQQRQASAERSPEAADADVPVVLTHMCSSSAEHRVSCSGMASPPRQQSPGCGEQLQQQQQAEQDMASGAGASAKAAAADAAAAAAAAAAGQQEQQGMHALVEGDGQDWDDSGAACGGSCGREASIMRQTQVALTTWRHLQSTASTPSTVMQGTGQPNRNATETALTASSAVQ